MKHYHVVAAIIEHEGKILCVQKGKTKFDYTTYKYEFPGGKVEEGETPQQALKREIAEELNYPITVTDYIVTVEHEYPDFAITMEAYLCKANDKNLTLSEHINAVWLAPSELHSLDWAAADVGIVEAVQNLTILTTDN